MADIALNYQDLGLRVRRYRQGKGLTQAALAELVDLVPSNISHIERATTSVSLPTLVRIANVLGVSLDQLVCDSLAAGEPLLQGDIAKLLEDCTPAETKVIRDIIVVTKDTMRKNMG